MAMERNSSKLFSLYFRFFYGPTHEISFRMRKYIQKPMVAYLAGQGVNLGLNLYLNTYFAYASSESSGESAPMRTRLTLHC